MLTEKEKAQRIVAAAASLAKRREKKKKRQQEVKRLFTVAGIENKTEIARRLGVHPNTILKDFREFREKGETP